MLLVVPVSRSDAHLIPTFELGLSLFQPGAGHDLLVVGSPNVAAECEKLAMSLARYFVTVKTFTFQNDNHFGWPMACNYYWQQTAYHIAETSKSPWFWMELDSTPVKPGWLNSLQLHWMLDSSHFPFMGVMDATVRGSNGAQEPPEVAGSHMAPVGVYPANTPEYVINLPAVGSTTDPWFQFVQWMILPRLTTTNLLQNNWRTLNYRHGSEGIICDSDANLAWNVHYNSVILDETVVVHGCKDGSLVALLTPTFCPPEPNEPTPSVPKIRRKARRKKRTVKPLTA